MKKIKFTAVISFMSLVVIFTFLTSCQMPSDTMPKVVISEENKAKLFRAKLLAKRKKYEESEKILDSIKGSIAAHKAANQLLNQVKQEHFVHQLEADRIKSKEIGIREASANEILPNTYATQITIDGKERNPELPTTDLEKLLEKRISVDIQEGDLQTVILSLAQISGINIIADNSIEATQSVTIKVVDVPLKEILNYIARNMSVSFQLGENTIWVTKQEEETPNKAPELKTRLYHLRAGVIPKIGEDGPIVVSGTFTNEEGGDGVVADSSNNITELEDLLSTFIVDSPTGSMYRFYHNRNVLIVKNSLKNLRIIDSLIKEFDKPILQVLIEAKFITISNDDLEEVGFKVNDITVHADGNNPTIYDTSKLLSKFPGPDGNFNFSGVIGNTEFNAVIHAVSETKSSVTLSAPKITVINNHTAKITNGDIIRYYEEYEAPPITVISDGGVTPNTPQDFVPVGTPIELQTGIELDVRPTISNDGRQIMLDLKPTISEFNGWDLFPGGIKLPKTAEHTLETKVVVNNGDTIILGGMMTNSTQNDDYQIPIIKEIPLIGPLFGHRNYSESPKHLLIFITIKVVNPSGEYLKVNTKGQ
jgi:type II secretory pathway component GspD/PulD (secretin)